MYFVYVQRHGQGRAADDEMLYRRASDSFVAFCLKISPAKSFATNVYGRSHQPHALWDECIPYLESLSLNESGLTAIVLFFLKVGWVRPKRGCLLTLAYYAFPRWYEFGEWRWNDILTRENRRTRRETCPSATLSTTNPTWLDPGENLGLRGERPATNHLSHSTAYITAIVRTSLSWEHIRMILKYSVWLRAGRPGDRGSIPSGGKGFFLYPLCPDRLWGPPSLLYNGYRGSFPWGVKRGRGVMLTTHPHLVQRSWMSRSYGFSLPKRLHGV
jgi:hypothetical protein